MKMSHIAAAISLAAATSFANATVTIDPETGYGFVGKGDVQLAFGWNNAALQLNAGALSFTYNVNTEYSAVCTFTTGEGTRGERTHNIIHTEVYGLNHTVAYELRTRNQITGFTLEGFSSTQLNLGTVPVYGEACPGNPGTEGTWSSVTVGATSDELTVTHAGQSRTLTISTAL